MTDKETWLPVVGYEGLYSISDQGRVRRDASAQGARPGRILKASITPQGYLQVSLCRNGISRHRKVHILVMAAFAGPGPAAMEVNHRSGIKHDNRRENLEYATRSENMKHAFRTGLAHGRFGESSGRAVLTDAAVREIKAALAQGTRRLALARRYGVGKWVIRHIAEGKTWRHVA